tara:strand:+ start:1017 stop:1601 length:585 start_codon:yes stop_codon:yes gene_type:complete
MQLLNKFVQAMAILCGWGLLTLCALTFYDIVARRLLGHSIQGVDEIGGYMLATTASIGFGIALISRLHTRIDLILVRLPDPMQAMANTVAMIALAGFAVFMTEKAIGTVMETLEFGSVASTPLQTPLWIPQSVWLFGIALFAVIACAMAAHSIILLIRRDWTSANEHYGPPSLEEETEASLSAAAPAEIHLGDK